ncbi:hypothetical protein [Tahibacter aquaticus]|nr:hypothetical protein [Tahibacter aquaticus]
MFIFWGTKRVQKRLGYVADFCPLCRSPRAFRLSRIGMAGHVYGVSVGGGKLAGFERFCLTCKTVLGAEHEAYSNIAKDYPLERVPESNQISHLIRATNPELAERYARRLELEQDLRRGNAVIDTATRKHLIKEPFLILAPAVERAFESTHIDLPLLLTIAAAIAVPIGAFWLFDLFLVGDAKELMPMFLAAIGLASFVAVLVQGHLAKNRFLRRHFYPKLAQALVPLRPQPAELAMVLSELRQLGFALGKRTNPAALEPLLRPA